MHNFFCTSSRTYDDNVNTGISPHTYQNPTLNQVKSNDERAQEHCYISGADVCPVTPTLCGPAHNRITGSTSSLLQQYVPGAAHSQTCPIMCHSGPSRDTSAVISLVPWKTTRSAVSISSTLS